MNMHEPPESYKRGPGIRPRMSVEDEQSKRTDLCMHSYGSAISALSALIVSIDSQLLLLLLLHHSQTVSHRNSCSPANRPSSATGPNLR